MNSTLAMVSFLRGTTNDVDKRKVSDLLFHSFCQESKYLNGLFLSALNFIRLENREPLFTKVSRGDFFETRIVINKDESVNSRVLVSVVYVQDHENNKEDLDENVAGLFCEYFEKENLDLVFTDIMVNNIHFSYGKKVN